MNLLFYMADMLFPQKCIICGGILGKGETDLCKTCRTQLREFSQENLKLQFLDSFTAIWYYEGNVRQSLHRYKFRNARHYAQGYGRMLAMKLLRKYPEGFDCITWVPISPRRKLTRGYDQDELIAKVVARELGMACVPLLRKIRNNPPQSGIRDYAERKANVLGSYRTVNQEQIPGKRILLLDDILTTGATAGECARMLLTAGAREVHCAVIAATRK